MKLSVYQDRLREALTEFLGEEYGAIQAKGNDRQSATFDHLRRLVLSGKLVRGAMFLELATLDKTNEITKELLGFAMALELVHTAFLIHDDVMDNSNLRRYLPSMHRYSAQLFEKDAEEISEHDAYALAICVGDMAIFMAQQFLVEHRDIARVMNEEWCAVSWGQWKDVVLGLDQFEEIKNIKPIIALYKEKTARYSCSLPFVLAGVWLEYSAAGCKLLYDIGENIGIIYQIDDDYLDIFGKLKDTGKNSSDIANDKKTLYSVMLYQNLSAEDKLLFEQKVKDNNIEWIREKMNEYGIIEKVDEIRGSHINHINKYLESVSVDMREILREIIHNLTNRVQK